MLLIINLKKLISLKNITPVPIFSLKKDNDRTLKRLRAVPIFSLKKDNDRTLGTWKKLFGIGCCEWFFPRVGRISQ